jgi:hypothetical protein
MTHVLRNADGRTDRLRRERSANGLQFLGDRHPV